MSIQGLSNQDPFSDPPSRWEKQIDAFDAQAFNTIAANAIKDRIQAILAAGQKGDTTTVVALLSQLRTAAAQAGGNKSVSLNTLLGIEGLGGLISGPPPQSLSSVASLMQAPQTIGPAANPTTVSLWDLLADPNKTMTLDLSSSFLFMYKNHGLMPPSGGEDWKGLSWFADGHDFGINPSNDMQSIWHHYCQMEGSQDGSPTIPNNYVTTDGFSLNIQYHETTEHIKGGDTVVIVHFDSMSMSGPASSFAAWLAGSSNFCSSLLKLFS